MNDSREFVEFIAMASTSGIEAESGPGFHKTWVR
jgi:hypothetical protein